MLVANAARVSFSKQSEWKYIKTADDDGLGEYWDVCLQESDAKLINYLAKHNHWTPFAHPQICLHIKAPFPIRTQFFKHKVGFVENEVSRRYVDKDPEFFYPDWSARPTGSMKQGAGEKLDEMKRNLAYLNYSQSIDLALGNYKNLLMLGVAPEQARFILPMGAYTEWYWTGSLAAYARFYNQRTDPHAQAEIREYAQRIGTIIAEHFPVSWAALINTPSNPS